MRSWQRWQPADRRARPCSRSRSSEQGTSFSFRGQRGKLSYTRCKTRGFGGIARHALVAHVVKAGKALHGPLGGVQLLARGHNSAALNEAGHLAVDHARNLLRDERMMLDAFADLVRRQRTLLVGTVAPAPVWHLTALTVERFPGTLLNPFTLPEDESRCG